MYQLSTISMFVRALGAFAAFAPANKADKVVQYTNKAANLIDLADSGRLAFEHAQVKLASDAEQMQRWVDTNYEPTDADFDALEANIDELHDRYQAHANQSPG